MKYILTALLTITAYSQQFKNEAATKATKRYHLSILKARQRYSKDMKKAKLSAMQKGQLEEAIKIDKAIKQITGRPDDGVYTMILRDQETFKRQHYNTAQSSTSFQTRAGSSCTTGTRTK
jgi:hypothetical protein